MGIPCNVPGRFSPAPVPGFCGWCVYTHTRARANTSTRLSLLCLHANSFRSRFVCERLRTFRIGRGRSWQHFASARGGFWWDVCTQHTCIIHSVSVRKQRVNKVPNERCAWTCDWMRREHTRLGFSGSADKRALTWGKLTSTSSGFRLIYRLICSEPSDDIPYKMTHTHTHVRKIIIPHTSDGSQS